MYKDQERMLPLPPPPHIGSSQKRPPDRPPPPRRQSSLELDVHVITVAVLPWWMLDPLLPPPPHLKLSLQSAPPPPPPAVRTSVPATSWTAERPPPPKHHIFTVDWKIGWSIQITERKKEDFKIVTCRIQQYYLLLHKQTGSHHSLHRRSLMSTNVRSTE